MKATWIAALGFCLVVGLPLVASAGPNLDATDTDGDGVADSFDNCVDEPNGNQADADHNGCGDACSIPCDVDGDGIVGGAEFSCVIANFGKTVGVDATQDCNCEGDPLIGGGDFSAVVSNFGKTNGNSGIPLDNPLHNIANCFPKE